MIENVENLPYAKSNKKIKGGLPPMKEAARASKKSVWGIIQKDFSLNKYLYLLALAGILYYIIFIYVPMFGVIMAFQNFNITKGVFGSPFVGLKHFKSFFSSYFCGRLIRNTLLINVYNLIFSFPIPIVFALLLNELHNPKFKKTVQTISYLPYFISMVVIGGLIHTFTAENGLISNIVSALGGPDGNLLIDPANFRTIFVASNIWQYFGWDSIIYIAALAGIDVALYEAATVDGAGRWRKMWNITLPGIKPTIIIMLILRLGSMMSVGFEKIILLYNPSTYETADVISSFVYRRGIQEADYSFSAAVGLFNSLVNLVLLVTSNLISRKVSETSLW